MNRHFIEVPVGRYPAFVILIKFVFMFHYIGKICLPVIVSYKSFHWIFHDFAQGKFII